MDVFLSLGDGTRIASAAAIGSSRLVSLIVGGSV
jgi:hypothetical protein